jgi:NAD(P)-dependent dehydrogenase (short-subunit alcohol dehydrogenase family)
MYDTMVGRRAIVTGAASGIGEAIAHRLAAEGARVAVLDLDGAGARRVAGALDPASLAVPCDLRAPAEVTAAVTTVVDAWDGIDILVNNAGVLGRHQPLIEYPEDEFRHVLEVNLFGAYRMTRAVLPFMLSQAWGRIVNIASIAARVGGPGLSAYAAAKAGLVGMSKALAGETATTGVIVNCVAPGGVGETAMSRGAPAGTAAAQRHPMKRLARPAEVAALVAWLCTDEVSFTTGAVFDISGGRSPS